MMDKHMRVKSSGRRGHELFAQLLLDMGCQYLSWGGATAASRMAAFLVCANGYDCLCHTVNKQVGCEVTLYSNASQQGAERYITADEFAEAVAYNQG